jgi:hypothetical protein
MNMRLMIAFAAATILTGGCAMAEPQRDGIHQDGTFTQELGNSGAKNRDILLRSCRVPCTVSPGPGCC